MSYIETRLLCQVKQREHSGYIFIEKLPDLKNAALVFFPLAGIFTLPIGVLIVFQFARANFTHQIKENLLVWEIKLLETGGTPCSAVKSQAKDTPLLTVHGERCAHTFASSCAIIIHYFFNS